MELPGGVVVDGQRRTQCVFKSVTGAIELAIADSRETTESLPNQITKILLAAVDQIADEEPNWNILHELSIGDRQFLLRQLAIYLGHDGLWLSPRCSACGSPFDIHFQQSMLPVKTAGKHFPVVHVDTSQGHCQFRIPTGADQAAVASIDSETLGLKHLLSRLWFERGDRNVDDFKKKDFDAIDKALEQASPEVTRQVQTACPECGEINTLEIDPYKNLEIENNELLIEIHQLASSYNWSEAEILALPRARRRQYLHLIDRAKGISD